MPQFLKNRQNILLITFLLLIIVGGYLLYSYSSRNKLESGVVSVGADGGKKAPDAEFLRLLDRLQSLKLDKSIFQEPIFQSLVDLSPELAPQEKKGRPNPFLPF